MYEHLQENVPQKRFIPTQRHYPSSKLHDCYALQPWEKNTLEMNPKQVEISRQAKTFYNAPSIKIQQRHYMTHRGFSFRNQTQNKVDKSKSLAQASRNSAISHYNINGNILGDKVKCSKYFPFQLPTKRIRSLKSKEVLKSKGIEDIEQFNVCQSVVAMKKRISLQRQKSEEGLVGVERGQQKEKFQFGRKRSKVISLGYQKLTRFKGLTKQRSLQFNIDSIQS